MTDNDTSLFLPFFWKKNYQNWIWEEGTIEHGLYLHNIR